jgi:hypothetical protein
MDDAMTDDQLRHWAEHNQDHSSAARGVLRLLADLQAAQDEIARVAPYLANHRVGGYSFGPVVRTADPTYDETNPLRTIPAVFDGSTGTPPHGVAGHKSESEQ